MLKFISMAFSGPRKPPSPNEAIDSDALRKIVSARSHGNVRLQKGLFYTKEDVDAKFAKLNGTRFAD